MHIVATTRPGTSQHTEMLGQWIMLKTHICKKCAGYACKETGGAERWGCIACDFVTSNPLLHFRKCQIYYRKVEASDAQLAFSFINSPAG